MIRRSWLRRMQQDGAGIGELGALQRLIRGEGGRPHPNVVPLLEALADRAFLYLVFPYAEGGELFQRVRKVYPQGMPEAEARACFAQVVAGLGRLKAAGLTHGYVGRGAVVW